VTHGGSVQGPSDKEAREKFATLCERTADVMDGITAVSPLLNDKGLTIAVTARLLALGLRFAASEARGR